MKWSHIAIAGMLTICGACLMGFKKPPHHITGAAGKAHAPAHQISEPKSLDLSLPSRNVSFEEAYGDSKLVQTRYAGLNDDTAVNRPKSRPLELKGNVIMSQEPEAEKTKSADGAGIMINLRH